MRRKKGRLAMNARKQGGVLVREQKLGRIYALRFRAYGERQYLTLGYEHGGWNLDKASVELQSVLADVRRGLWMPPKKRRGASERVERGEAQPLGPFALDLTESRVGQVAEKTTKHERWALGHLVPFFGDWVLNEIDVEGVDEYRAFKAKESEARARAIERGKPKRNDHGQILRLLSAGSINRTIDYLQGVLSIAIEYRRFGITENTVEGKRRRLRQKRPAPGLHRQRRAGRGIASGGGRAGSRPPLRTHRTRGHSRHLPLRRTSCARAWQLALARCRPRWRPHIHRPLKTEAGLREIKILPILCDILATYKALVYRGDPDALVFPTLAGARRDPDNLRARVLAPTFERADDLLESRGQVPLSRGLTTHKLRHAFASILVALWEDPISVMAQIGNTDPKSTLRVYTHMMSLDPDDRGRLKALVRGEQVIARSAPLPRPVDLAEYEAPIVAALAERGGRAPRREILAAVGEAMARRHGAADLEELPSGGPRWQPRFSKARARLVERGWLEATAWRGDWGLTERGWGKARRDRVRSERPRV